eukprot:736066-Rhodomonas_salina.2
MRNKNRPACHFQLRSLVGRPPLGHLQHRRKYVRTGEASSERERQVPQSPAAHPAAVLRSLCLQCPTALALMRYFSIGHRMLDTEASGVADLTRPRTPQPD